jgi:hypothetical protein
MDIRSHERVSWVLSMRRSGFTRLEVTIGAALVAAVVGLGVAVFAARRSHEKMSNARRDLADMSAVQVVTPSASAATDSAPPKTKRSKKTPRTSSGGPSAIGPHSPLSALPRGGDDDDDSTSDVPSELEELDEMGPSIFLLAPLDGLMDFEDDSSTEPSEPGEPSSEGEMPVAPEPPTATDEPRTAPDRP